MLRATAYLPAGHGKTPFDQVVLEHDERRLRRKLLRLRHGDEVLVDFLQTITLDHRSVLQLDDGRFVEVIAADEQLYEVRGRDTAHLVRLAWHIGNRHTSAQLDADRILIKRDHVLRTMLEGLGATIAAVSEPFYAEHGAYHAHAEPGHALLNR
ncbi:urease accessory protein UreE [Devosia sp.]|uniref:urease accessory protein UreE n=1 Tax=Devosia sp. TaxID=1871048 RepID=UPI0032639109